MSDPNPEHVRNTEAGTGTGTGAQDLDAFATTFTSFLEAMKQRSQHHDHQHQHLSALGEHVAGFLGQSLDQIEPVTEVFPNHHVVDVDIALETLLTRHHGVRHGVAGAHRGHVESFADFLTGSMGSFRLGALTFERRATGPDSDRPVVTLGLGQVHLDGVPLIWLQRTASPQYGRDRFSLEVLCPERATTEGFLHDLRSLMAEQSVLRGQIVTFTSDEFDYHQPGADLTYLRRPELGADQVILPDGVRDRVARHVIDIGERRDVLRAAGQHLKRGVLLYGPPGTGKTHLIRHLLAQTAGTTAVLLSGRTLGLMNVATQLARAAQPAIVVMEDCDLVAEHRGGDSNAALFETLEAMDGLTADADICFVLTTNRVDLLERALVERPGRIDLAVEIAKPDLEARIRLFQLYGAELLTSGALGEEAVRDAAERTEGVTASFTKELIRRCVIGAAQRDRSPTAADLDAALTEMLSDAESLTRTLLGGTPAWASDVDPSGAPLGPPEPTAYSSSWSMTFDDEP